MNWQVVTFFGDSTVLLPSAAVLFRAFSAKRFKAAGLALGAAVRHNRRNCLRIKTGIYGLGYWDSRAGLHWL